MELRGATPATFILLLIESLGGGPQAQPSS